MSETAQPLPARPAASAAARLPIIAAAVAAAIVVYAVTQLGSVPYTQLSRGFPGTATSMASAVLRLIADVSGGATLGGLVTAAVVTPRRSRTAIDNGRDLRIVRIASAVWLGAAVLLIPVDAADAGGQPISKLLEPGALGYLTQASYLPGAWIVVACIALTILIVANAARGWVTTVLLAAIGAVAILAPVLVTQVLVGPNHDFGGDAAMFETPAAAIWLGASIAIVVRWHRHGRPGDATLRRYRALALTSWVVWTIGTLIVAAVELAGTAPWSTTTGTLFTVQLVLVAAAAAPILLRRRGVTSFTGVAALLSVQLLATAIGVVMTRIPPPVYFVSTNSQQLFLGYRLDTPLTPFTLFLDGRVNILFLVISLTGIIAYAAGVRRLRRRGDRWSAGRTISWMLGWVVVIITTSSGIGPYSSASFAVHMALHMSLNMLGPLLLVLGGPITLFLRSTTAHRRDDFAGPHEWIVALMHSKLLRVTYNPMYVLAVFVGSYYAIYLTPFFGWAMRYHWAHQGMTLHYLAIGYIFYSLVIGVDAPPRPLPHIGKLGLVLAAMPFHAFFGVVVMTSSSLLAGEYYRYLDVSWIGSLAHDQYVAGGIAWAAGELPLLVVVIALVTQWAKQDAQQARTIDRHADAGLDDDHEQYNEMLLRLAARDARTPDGSASGNELVVTEHGSTDGTDGGQHA